MRDMASRRGVRWVPRFLLLVAVSLGLLIMHGDLPPSAGSMPGPGAVAVAQMATQPPAGITSAGPGAGVAQASDHAEHAMDTSSMMPGAMDCAGMLTGGDMTLAVPDMPGDATVRPAGASVMDRSSPVPVRWGRARPEVLRT